MTKGKEKVGSAFTEDVVLLQKIAQLHELMHFFFDRADRGCEHALVALVDKLTEGTLRLGIIEETMPQSIKQISRKSAYWPIAINQETTHEDVLETLKMLELSAELEGRINTSRKVSGSTGRPFVVALVDLVDAYDLMVRAEEFPIRDQDETVNEILSTAKLLFGADIPRNLRSTAVQVLNQFAEGRQHAQNLFSSCKSEVLKVFQLRSEISDASINALLIQYPEPSDRSLDVWVSIVKSLVMLLTNGEPHKNPALRPLGLSYEDKYVYSSDAPKSTKSRSSNMRYGIFTKLETALRPMQRP